MNVPTDLRDELRGRDLLVDSNLLFLWILGATDRTKIEHSGRTRRYSPADFDVLDEFLRKIIRRFDVEIVVTSHVLTEVSNLANDLKGDFRARFFEKFADVIQALIEIQAPARDITDWKRFSDFGLTDLITLEVARSRCNVLTDDGRLADYLRRQGVHALRLPDLKGSA